MSFKSTKANPFALATLAIVALYASVAVLISSCSVGISTHLSSRGKLTPSTENCPAKA